MAEKKYNLTQSWEAWHGKCPECGEKLDRNGTTDQGWTYLYKCKSCKAEFSQTAPATGNDPWLTKTN